MADETTSKLRGLRLKPQGVATPGLNLARNTLSKKPSVRAGLSDLFKVETSGIVESKEQEDTDVESEPSDSEDSTLDYLDGLSNLAKSYHLRASSAGFAYYEDTIPKYLEICIDLLSKIDLPAVLRVEVLAFLGQTYTIDRDDVPSLTKAAGHYQQAFALCQPGSKRTEDNHDTEGNDMYNVLSEKYDSILFNLIGSINDQLTNGSDEEIEVQASDHILNLLVFDGNTHKGDPNLLWKDITKDAYNADDAEELGELPNDPGRSGRIDAEGTIMGDIGEQGGSDGHTAYHSPDELDRLVM